MFFDSVCHCVNETIVVLLYQIYLAQCLKTLYPPPSVVHYNVTVVTGKRLGSGTDADVYLCIVGERGDTGDRWLRKAKNTINKFEKGAVSQSVGNL